MYKLPNKPEKITFDWLFNRVNQEDVYLFYLGFCELGRKFTNPLRNDSKADCTFFWYNNVLFFKDFASRKTYSCISIIMEIKHLTYFSALDLVYDKFLDNKGDMFTIKPKIEHKVKEYKNIEVKVQAFTQDDITYLKQFGVTSELCKQYNVYSLSHYWINSDMKYVYNTYNPCLGYHFNGRWKIYHYKSKDYRFVSNTSHADLQGYDQLDWIGDLLIITKSLKDVMVFRKYGINAVAPHSECLADWKDKIESLHKRFTKVILNFDNDGPGIAASNEVINKYQMETFFVPDEKDISDYHKVYGAEKTKQLLEQLK